MAKSILSNGTAHTVPADLKAALTSTNALIKKWESLTPLARNEWICWNISNKKPETRANHIKRTKTELLQGKRRPCCWAGCIHRSDKALSPSQKWVKSKQKTASTG